MTETTGPERVDMRSTVPASSFLATMLITLVAIVVLLFFDLFLTELTRRAAAALATGQYEAGERSLAAGDPSAAADAFEAAVASDRQNTSYALGLADAMLAEGRLDDAESTIRSLLGRAENDGAVNLTMARVMAREGRLDESTAYYHRAIYGQWGADSLQRRQAVRIELIDLLVRRRAPRAIAAELLPLEESAPDSAPLRFWIAERFMLAGSPARAADEFRQAIRLQPANAQAYAGLGEASLSIGNFRSAHADLLHAARLAPSDTGIASKLALVDSTLALDPTLADLTASDRAARSQTLLASTLASVLACGVHTPLTDSASAALAAITPGKGARGVVVAPPSAPRMISTAVALWATRPPGCPLPPHDQPLAFVQARLAQ